MSEYSDLYRQFSILPHNEYYYSLAFTHSSYNGMIGTRHEDYERLEFLGDSLIGFVVSYLCYSYHPDMSQGDLSILKAQFIKTNSEADYCLKLGLNKYIKVGASYQTDPATSRTMLEDIFESFIGAVILDQGVEFAFNLVKKLFDEDIRNAVIKSYENPKSLLQEAMQAEHKESVTYKILEESGPAHDKHFLAAVYFEDAELGRGEGKNKKAAEAAAASKALEKLAILKDR